MRDNDYTTNKQQQTNDNTKTTQQQQHDNQTFNLIERMSHAESDFVTRTSNGPEPVRIYGRLRCM